MKINDTGFGLVDGSKGACILIPTIVRRLEICSD